MSDSLVQYRSAWEREPTGRADRDSAGKSARHASVSLSVSSVGTEGEIASARLKVSAIMRAQSSRVEILRTSQHTTGKTKSI
jgi:hypothetical protein